MGLPSASGTAVLDELVEDRRACCDHRDAGPEELLDVVVVRIGVGQVRSRVIA